MMVTFKDFYFISTKKKALSFAKNGSRVVYHLLLLSVESLQKIKPTLHKLALDFGNVIMDALKPSETQILKTLLRIGENYFGAFNYFNETIQKADSANTTPFKSLLSIISRDAIFFPTSSIVNVILTLPPEYESQQKPAIHDFTGSTLGSLLSLGTNSSITYVQARRSASVKYNEIGLEKAVYHFVGVSAEVQFSGHASDGEKFSAKDLSTRNLRQYLDALKICQRFLPGLTNDPQRQDNVLSVIPLPTLPSGDQPTTGDQEMKLLVKEPPEMKWQDSDKGEYKQDESRKQYRRRQLGEIPIHKSLVDTGIKLHSYDGEKRIKDPSYHYVHNYYLLSSCLPYNL